MVALIDAWFEIACLSICMLWLKYFKFLSVNTSFGSASQWFRLQTKLFKCNHKWGLANMTFFTWTFEFILLLAILCVLNMKFYLITATEKLFTSLESLVYHILPIALKMIIKGYLLLPGQHIETYQSSKLWDSVLAKKSDVPYWPEGV